MDHFVEPSHILEEGSMSRVIIFVLLVGMIAFAGCAGNSAFVNGPDRSTSTITFGESWNNNCGYCNFSDNSAAGSFTTLGDLYNGSDFNVDIFVMDALISTDLGEPVGLAGASEDALYIWYDDDADEYD